MEVNETWLIVAWVEVLLWQKREWGKTKSPFSSSLLPSDDIINIFTSEDMENMLLTIF